VRLINNVLQIIKVTALIRRAALCSGMTSYFMPSFPADYGTTPDGVQDTQPQM